MNNTIERLLKNGLVVLFIFIAGTLVVFMPSFGRIFSSDDFCTLEYICKDNHFLVPGFFRPVGDLTLKWTWQLFGAQPFYFYLTNALIHAVNAWLLFIVCRKIYPQAEHAFVFALMASLTFFFYHSHGEAILWTIGRGVLLAVFFALAAIVAFLSQMRFPWKCLLVCVLYFIGLAAYESIFLLPVVLWLVSKNNRYPVRFGKWAIALGVTLAIHLVLRQMYTGDMMQTYSGTVLGKGVLQFMLDGVKIIFRVFVPAFNRPALFAGTASAVVAIVLLIGWRSRKTVFYNAAMRRVLIMGTGGLICAIAVAMIFSVSTRTAEGDRLLYFPACFFSIIIALLLMQVSNSSARAALLIVLTLVQGYFLVTTRNYWIRASEYSEQIVNEVKRTKERPLYIVNLPADYRGGYIFRNCFHEALSAFGVNSKNVVVINSLGYVDATSKDGVIVPEKKDGQIFIWPSTTIFHRSGIVNSIKNEGNEIKVNDVPLSAVFYWDKTGLRHLY